MSEMLYFYPLIIILGILSSYTDIKYHIIKNRHLVYCGVLAIVVYLYLGINHKLSFNHNTLINIIVGAIIAYLLYALNIWGAGDAKLFMVFSLLMPTQRHANIAHFPSVILFISIFLLSMPAMLVLTVYVIIKNKDNFIGKINFVDLGKKIIHSFFIILSLNWIISYFSGALKIYFSPATNIVIIFIAYGFFYRFISSLKKKIFFFVIFGCIGLISQFILHPEKLNLLRIGLILLRILKYTIVFYFINALLFHDKDKKSKKESIPFAPFMFIGTIVTDTNFIYYAARFINLISR